MSTWKAVLAGAAAGVAIATGLVMMIAADSTISTQFGIGMLLVLYAPSVLERRS